MSSLDPSFDLHVTYDFGSTMKVNTGLFVLKTSSWSWCFLEQVWLHNDFGEGRSDQNSINHVLSTMPTHTLRAHVKVRDVVSCLPRRAAPRTRLCCVGDRWRLAACLLC